MQDIPSGIDLLVQFKATRRIGTAMPPNGQGFPHQRTATAAALRRMGRVHKCDMTTSISRFVAQQRLEQAKSRIVRRQGQVRMVGHESQVQVFQDNQGVGADQPMREACARYRVGNGRRVRAAWRPSTT